MFFELVFVSDINIQQIVTLSKYGHDALNICRPYSIDILYVISYARVKMFKSILEIKVERVFFLVVINLLTVGRVG